jgi:hypothetical protein
LQAEATSPALRDKYEKEVANMLETKLEGFKKWHLIGSGVITFIMGGFFGYTGITQTHLPALIRIGFGGGALFGFAWTGMVAWIVHRKSLNKKTDTTFMAHWAWGAVLFNMVIILLVGGKNPDSTRSVFMAVSGLVFLLMGALFMLANRIEQSELRTREKLLEIELKLLQMGGGGEAREG